MAKEKVTIYRMQSKQIREAAISKLPESLQKKLRAHIASIPKTRFFKPDGKPNREWRMLYGDLGTVAKDAARQFGWDAAWSAARDASLVAAQKAKRNAARSTAWAAAWDATPAGARVAALDAALFADYIVVSDLDFKDKDRHLAHAKARWEVWQKGYGLLCDMDGVLYVYDVKPKWVS